MGFDFLDVLTGKLTLEDNYMNQVDHEIEKIKPQFELIFFNTFYLAGISEVLVEKGLMSKEDDEALLKAAKEKVKQELDKKIAEAREEARKSFADEMSKFGDKKESVENGGISSC